MTAASNKIRYYDRDNLVSRQAAHKTMNESTVEIVHDIHESSKENRSTIHSNSSCATTAAETYATRMTKEDSLEGSMIETTSAESLSTATPKTSDGGRDSCFYVLPKCMLPPREELKVVEMFVANAVNSRHDPTADQHKGAYRALLEAIQANRDGPMIRNICIALRTAGVGTRTGTGTTLHQLSSSPKEHQRLLHYIFRMNPFEPSRDPNADKAESKQWLKPFRDNSLADAYLHLLMALVSANSVFLVPAMRALWGQMGRLLQSMSDWLKNKKLKGKAVAGTTPNDDEQTLLSQIPDNVMKQVTRVHMGLATMTRLCPKAKIELFPILRTNFPFRYRPAPVLEWFYVQSFTVLEYLPTIRQQLLSFMIDKSLEMDVEIKVHDSGDVTIEQNNDNSKDDDDDDQIFQLDDVHIVDDNYNDKQKSNDGASTVKKDGKENDKEANAVDIMADKLDTLLLYIFKYIATNVQKQNQHQNPIRNMNEDQSVGIANVNQCSAAISLQECQDLFSIITSIFESSILTTHKSKFVQFILFYLCGLYEQQLDQINRDGECESEVGFESGALYRSFATQLIGIVHDPYRALVTRQSAACYLASFVSRATYVCPQTVCEAVCNLLRWAEKYIDTLDAAAKERTGVSTVRQDTYDDLCELHSMFYTVCQAAFYIMCFRGRAAVQFFQAAVDEYLHNGDDDEENQVVETHLQTINIAPKSWQKICDHPQLKPLQFCLESVRYEFLHVAWKFGLLPKPENPETEMKMLMGHFESKVNTQSNSAHRQPLSTRRGFPQRRRRRGGGGKISTPATLEKERVSGGVGGLGRGTNPLDSFFPFDPFLLRRSHDYIEPFYNHWNGSVTEDDESGNAKNEEGRYDIVADDDSCDEASSVGRSSESEEENDEDDEESEDSDDDSDTVASTTHMNMNLSSTPEFGFGAQQRFQKTEIIMSEQCQKQLKRPRAPSIECGSW